MSVPSEAEQPSIRIVSPPDRRMRQTAADCHRRPPGCQRPRGSPGSGRGARAPADRAAGAPAHAVPTRGDLPILVILRGFPRSPARARPRLLRRTPECDRLVAYYAEVSSGRLRIVPHVGGPVVTLPEPRARYVQRPAALARDAIARVRAAAVRRRTTSARCATAQGVDRLLRRAGPRVARRGRRPGRSRGRTTRRWRPPVGRIHDAVRDRRGGGDRRSAPSACCAHEFGHLLGLPELYAPGGATHEGIGVWGLMGQGTWLGHGDQPPHLEAWSKAQARLGRRRDDRPDDDAA